MNWGWVKKAGLNSYIRIYNIYTLYVYVKRCAFASPAKEERLNCYIRISRIYTLYGVRSALRGTKLGWVSIYVYIYV